MPSVTRPVRALLDRRLPPRTRVGLLALDLRRRIARQELYGVRYGNGVVHFTEADLRVDRASFDFAVREGSYATDYRQTLVVDLGAHKGYFGAYASAHGAHEVVAYEPERGNLTVLERTAKTYRRAGTVWTTHHAAVDAAASRAKLHVMDASWGHALEPPAEFADYEVGMETVDVVALGDVLRDAGKRANGRRVVVKMNIEGAECSAVLGTGPAAWERVDEVFIETHPWASCGADELGARLEQAGLGAVASAHDAVLRMRRAGPLRADPRSGPT